MPVIIFSIRVQLPVYQFHVSINFTSLSISRLYQFHVSINFASIYFGMLVEDEDPAVG